MKKTLLIVGAVSIMSGCATKGQDTQTLALQSELDKVQEKNQQLLQAVEKSNADVQRLSSLNQQLQSTQNDSAGLASGTALLPPNPKAGECYARVLIPAGYRTESEDVLKSAASYRMEVTEPVYEWVTEEILVKEASEVAELVPAKYEWKTETVMVEDAHEHLKQIPAVYETVTEKVLVKPAYTTWKKGRGPIEKIDNATGEIMCLIEVPAVYKTVASKVVKTPARVEVTKHDAVYKEIKKRVMVEGPKMVTRTIPAEYKAVKVRKVVQPAQETRVEIPAAYQSVSRKVKVSDSVLEWRTILCETNTSGDVVRRIQRALSDKGHHPGPIDGVIGRETLAAMKAYQQANNLAVGQLTIETIQSLGVSY